MKTLGSVLYTALVIIACYVAHSTLCREWATSLVASHGIKGYILVSIVLVAIGSVIWALPERFLLGRIGRNLALVFGGGTVGGMVVVLALFSAKSAGPFELICCFFVSIASLYQFMLLARLLEIKQDSKA